LVGDGCRLNRRHCQTVGASRTERSAARQVGDIVEWPKVLRRESVQDFVDENGNLVLNWLRHAQPVEADKRVGDVVGSTEKYREAGQTDLSVRCTTETARRCHDCRTSVRAAFQPHQHVRAAAADSDSDQIACRQTE